MSTIRKAVEIATKAHAGVKDEQGRPYLVHPIRVMMGVEGDATLLEAAQIVAVLHEVVEDTGVTIDDLRAEGFSQEVIAALSLVTHQKDQRYSEHVIACKPNEIARQVKLSDLRDNSQLARFLLRPAQFSGDSARMQRYFLSYRFLTDEITEDEYRQLMSSFDVRAS